MNNKMRYVFLILVVLSLVVTGCATEKVQIDPVDLAPPAVVPETTGDAIVDANAIQTDIVEDDLDATIDSINLDDW